MPTDSRPPSNKLALINSLITIYDGNSGQFAQTLRKNHIPHLSFSQITSVEFCRYQYYLQYVEAIEPDPIPTYFTKGKLLHQIIATSYQKIGHFETININDYFDLIDNQFSDEHNQHLKNAVHVHLDNLWPDCQVIAIEKPFVMILDEALPPCVGVIDLILRQNDRLIVIDHKTGRDFYPQDVLQMAIYADFIAKQYDADECVFFYEHYRWVNNLERIRKPAILKTEVVIPDGYWQDALNRIRDAHRQINKIVKNKSAAKGGDCFRCPYRTLCWMDD
jgi:CRISPR/Cas system-associated exonuclease Cas4 (RecB family)